MVEQWFWSCDETTASDSYVRLNERKRERDRQTESERERGRESEGTSSRAVIALRYMTFDGGAVSLDAHDRERESYFAKDSKWEYL